MTKLINILPDDRHPNLSARSYLRFTYLKEPAQLVISISVGCWVISNFVLRLTSETSKNFLPFLSRC